VDSYTEGLRCQDVNAGLRTFDATSAVLTPVKKTRLIGMAADLASLIRDRELISDEGRQQLGPLLGRRLDERSFVPANCGRTSWTFRPG
jgi:hypothetical protein